MKKLLVALLLIVSTLSISAMTERELGEYESYFGQEKAKILNKINESKSDKSNEGNLKLGILYTALSVNNPDEKKASGKAKKYLKKYLKKDSDHAMATVYLATSLSLVGRDHWNPIIKMSSVNNSFKYFDKAVELAEKNKLSNIWNVRLTDGVDTDEVTDLISLQVVSSGSFHHLIIDWRFMRTLDTLSILTPIGLKPS